MSQAWLMSLLTVLFASFAYAEEVDSQTQSLKWSPPEEYADNHPNQFLLPLVAIWIVIGLIGAKSMAPASPRTKQIPKKHDVLKEHDDTKVVGGKVCDVISRPTTRVTSLVHDVELGCASPSTRSGSASDNSQDDEESDEDWGPDWALDPFSEGMPESDSSRKSAELKTQDVLSINSLERGFIIDNPFGDDLPVVPRAKGKAD